MIEIYTHLEKLPYCQTAPVPCSVKQHANELETLLTIQQAITSHLDLDDVLQLIADEALRLTSAQVSLLYVLESGFLRVAAISGHVMRGELVGSRIPLDQSIAGLSVLAGQPMIQTDLQDDDAPVYRESVEHFDDIHCYITVPLIAANRIIGVIAVADQSTAVLGKDSLRILTMLAPTAAIGLENARLYQEQQERRLEAEGRHQMSDSLRVMLAILNSNRSFADILEYIVSHVSSRLLDCQATAIYSLQPKNNPVIQASHGLPPAAADHAQILPGYNAVKQAIQSRYPVVVTAEGWNDHPDISSEERAVVEQILSSFSTWLAVPLIVKGEVYGAVLMYYREPRLFTEEEINLASAFSDQVALAIENSRLRMQAEQAAVIAERNRLARELHDAVSQTLFSTSLIAEVLPRLWDKNQAEGRQRLEELRQLTRGALAEMRALLFELRPSAIGEARLGDLLKQLTQAIASRTRIPITLSVVDEQPLPVEVKVALYRITQEALNNVAKYADPSQVSVIYHGMAGEVVLSITDDGRGFIPTDVTPEHLGIRIMYERAAAINASIELNTNPGQGTSVHVIWSEPSTEE